MRRGESFITMTPLPLPPNAGETVAAGLEPAAALVLLRRPDSTPVDVLWAGHG